MSLGKTAVAAFVVALGAAVFWNLSTANDPKTVYEPEIKQIAAPTPCPWRDADADLTNWFPGATHYIPQDLILSGQRTLLQERLGRMLRPEEMALHCYLILSNDVQLGAVLTRRMKGEHGAVELAVGLGPNRRIQKVKIQRIREPEKVVQALSDSYLETQFRNASAQEFNKGPAAVPKQAEPLVKKIEEELAALLILHEAGQAELSKRHH